MEDYRVTRGEFASPRHARYGAFINVIGPTGAELTIIASDAGEPEAEGWEHVSVSIAHRTPNWREMDWVKDCFWEPGECVVQFHPPRKDWINIHPNCLHMWRYVKAEFPTPPSILVGPKGSIDGPTEMVDP